MNELSPFIYTRSLSNTTIRMSIATLDILSLRIPKGIPRMYGNITPPPHQRKKNSNPTSQLPEFVAASDSEEGIVELVRVPQQVRHDRIHHCSNYKFLVLFRNWTVRRR